jgi:hypothetical protein
MLCSQFSLLFSYSPEPSSSASVVVVVASVVSIFSHIINHLWLFSYLYTLHTNNILLPFFLPLLLLCWSYHIYITTTTMQVNYLLPLLPELMLQWEYIPVGFYQIKEHAYRMYKTELLILYNRKENKIMQKNTIFSSHMTFIQINPKILELRPIYYL